MICRSSRRKVLHFIYVGAITLPADPEPATNFRFGSNPASKLNLLNVCLQPENGTSANVRPVPFADIVAVCPHMRSQDNQRCEAA